MDGMNSPKDQTFVDQDSTNSTNQLVYYNPDNNGYTYQPLQPPPPATDTPEQLIRTKTKKTREPSPPLSPADKPTFRGPFGISIASTVIWYLCICILFVIAFICLILSILYFVTDTVTDNVVKLYGIAGSGTLAVITFIIIFLDCFNNSAKKDLEQEVLYNTMREKELKEKEMALRRKRRIEEGLEEKPKPFLIQHQRQEKTPEPPTPSPPPPPHHHHHFPPAFFAHSPYHHPFVCPVCHDLHASGNARHNLTDVAVDTSDKFAPVPKKNQVVHKSTRDAQTEPKLWDSERGTQTDRTEGTQTSTLELTGMPSNVTQIIHETTILKAPRSLITTLKKSMEQQDQEMAINHPVPDPKRGKKTYI